MATHSETFSADFIMGGVAAVIAKSAAAPIERVKLLLQNQGELMKGGQLQRPYIGVGNCFKRVFREEGILSFWRGNQANVIRYFPTQELAYLGRYFGIVARYINGKRQYNGLVDVYRQTVSSDGIFGLYRGFSVSIMGITLYRGMYFGIYDTMKPIVLVGPFQDNFVASFFLGWSVTTVSGVCAYPFDTIRRRMMLTSGQPVKYRNAIHAFREIIRVEGLSALFRGVTANILLGVAGAGVLAGYDQLSRIVYRTQYSLNSQKAFK